MADMSRRQTPTTFWQKVAVDDSDDGCWEWTASRYVSGYGGVRWHGEMRYAHRLAWELENGSIPEGKWILHRCDTPSCCRPSHLFLGDARTNVDDKLAKGRSNATGAKLTVATVQEIRRRAANGERQVDLASEFDVSPGSICKIVRRKTWR